jgi:hypothetical protein
MGKKVKTSTAWAGLVENSKGELIVDFFPMYSAYGVMFHPALFRSKKEARKAYQSVRRVEIREVPKKKGKRNG